MNFNEPVHNWGVDPDEPCVSQFPWVAHRTEDMHHAVSNVICPAADVIIASQLSNRTAMQIADAHNGLFTEHATDGTSLIHEV